MDTKVLPGSGSKQSSLFELCFVALTSLCLLLGLFSLFSLNILKDKWSSDLTDGVQVENK